MFVVNFNKQKKIDVLINDENFSKLSLPSKIRTYSIKKKEFFFYPLLISIIKNFFKLTLSKENILNDYIIILINKFRPKIILSHELKNKIYFIKKNFPNIITIIYQLNNYYDYYRSVTKKIISNNYKIKTFRADYLILKNNKAKSLLNFIKSKKIVLGSLKNNELKTKKYLKKKYDIMIISTFRKPVTRLYNIKLWGCMEVSDSNTSYLLKIVNELAIKKNLKICVALSSSRPDKDKISLEDEISFFKSELKNFSYEINTNSYQLAEKSKLIVNAGSTLGLDLISRGHKVFFLKPVEFIPGDITENFLFKSKSGLFWFNGSDKQLIKKKIINLLSLSHTKWKNTFKKFNTQPYDEGNKVLKKIIINLLKK